jgi:hypothetical protein
VTPRDTPLDALLASTVGVLSDRELSRRTGVHRDWFAAVRRGARVPRVHVVERVAEYLGLDRDAVTEAVLETVRRARRARRVT